MDEELLLAMQASGLLYDLAQECSESEIEELLEELTD